MFIPVNFAFMVDVFRFEESIIGWSTGGELLAMTAPALAHTDRWAFNLNTHGIACATSVVCHYPLSLIRCGGP